MDVTPRRMRDASIVDRTWERVTALNQLLLAGVVLVVSSLLMFTGTGAESGAFFAGVIIVFVSSGVAIVVPWSTVPHWVSGLLPMADIIAIGLLRDGAPTAGLGLLWVFPSIWMASQFGLRGFILGVSSISLIFITLVLTDPRQVIGITTLLLPLIILAVSATTYMTARRAGAQRLLLHKQSRMLEGALARARRQEMTVTQVLDAVDFGVIRITPDGEIMMTNEAHGHLQTWGRLNAVGRVDAVGSTRPELDDEDSGAGDTAYRADGIALLPHNETPFARALRGEEVDNEIVWFGQPGTTRRALSVTVRRLRDADGADEGAVLVSRDVTAELNAIRSREDLVASVSHELRTPLTSILGYIDLVLDGDLPASSRRGLEIAGRNANRLLAIVADILVASSEGSSMIELGIDPIDADLAEIARSSIEAFAPRAAERQITIDSAAIEPAVAFVDPARLRQVVDNLISNAIKYNRDGGTIDIGCTTDGRNAWLIVRDTGVGISEDETPRLFERFFRSESVRNTSTHGSGLGLSISREIVRSHRGEITVKSAIGEGTTIVVRVPVHPRRKERK